jgi:SAM-dependent methyltransferase
LSEVAFKYVGNELDTFSRARNWRSYWASTLRRYIAGDVLEVGAGIGANIAPVDNSQMRSIHCLEPDPGLATHLSRAARDIPGATVSAGTINGLAGRRFDTVLYIDVFEHIEDDQSELARAARLLRPGGRLIILAPAHQALYNSYDKALGHYRRYDHRRNLSLCSPASCRLEKMDYLDSVGLLASGANKVMLKQSVPMIWQILLWDRCMIPLSRALDRLLGYRLGKSIVAVWLRVG